MREAGPPHAAAAGRAAFVRDRMPRGGLFAGQEWRISPAAFPLERTVVEELEFLGRVLLQLNRALNLLYRLSVAGKQPEWIARWLDQGKPSHLIELQRALAFKNELTRVIRPDLLLTDSGIAITELDSVPGGIGLTAWLNQTYSLLDRDFPKTSDNELDFKIAPPPQPVDPSSGKNPISLPGEIIGGAEGMLKGFAGIFGKATRVHIIVSEESATYRPEMEWLAAQLDGRRFAVRDARFSDFAPGDAAYRFFELFDIENVSNAQQVFDLARAKSISLTPPAKAFLEEKMIFALLWNRRLRGFWHQELGSRFFQRLQELIPYTWLIDPAPLPPHAAIPELNLTDWQQLKTLSHRERELILKVSGFSESAWGARGVYLGSDLSLTEWSEAVDLAMHCFGRSPYILQRYHKPRVVSSKWFDFERNELIEMPGRVRLCPYYFVVGQGDRARPQLGGVLATICPANKKIIHGMKEAILAPCCVEDGRGEDATPSSVQN